AEKQALELSKALVSLGCGVLVLTRGRDELPSRETVSGVPVRRLPVLDWTTLLDSISFLLGSFLYLLFTARSYDAVHVHLGGSAAVGAALAGRLLGKSVVVKIGGGRGIGEIAVSSRTLAGRFKLLLLKLLKPQFICVARDLFEELSEHGLGSGALVVPNGVDLGHYRPAKPAEKAALRKALGWPSGLALLYVGRLAAEKRLDGFMKSFASALKKSPADAFFAVAGAGPEERLLRAEAARLGLSGKVLFLPPRHDIRELYLAADVFVLPSISEGLSNALLEAMACGLAVFAGRVGGNREAVEDGLSGLLFDPQDPEDEARRLGKLLLNPGLAAALGKSAREAAEARYSIVSTAERCLKLY
ncbi:MAG: glycosyltransferase family 4 protein, partial [Elusimicrobiota bacterium]